LLQQRTKFSQELVVLNGATHPCIGRNYTEVIRNFSH
jgi:hypothetical protein